MEPEISRRCRACGASVRSRAGFCPQCGSPVDAGPSNPSIAFDDARPDQMMEPPAELDSPGAPAATMASDVAPVASVPVTSVSAAGADENMPSAVGADESQAPPVEAATRGGDGDGGGEGGTTASAAATTRRHRVKVAARDAVEGRIAPRVEKLRQASNVVLDEAAEDPGLRFVLVAAVLIILSLVLLLLSQILK
ncbi:MAG TPA: zinc ribbon domain-containing protein [Pyrinomonadaceae bacterium]|nr:zinc ribbon domain-containing protein [Pyrinomonadaceae bacterium]